MTNLSPRVTNPSPSMTNPLLPQSLVSVMRNCMENTQQLQAAAAAAARTAGAATGRAPRQPNPAMVQHIVEMGFPQARAEEALRQVRGVLCSV